MKDQNLPVDSVAETPIDRAGIDAPQGVTEQRFHFTCDGMRLAATLFRPAGTGPHPAVLLCHGGGGIQDIAVRDFGARFASEGFAAMTFDYSSWGESEGVPRHVISLVQRHREIGAALDVLRATSGIDRGRIALWGTSLGGGQVLHMAARRSEVAAAIIQCAATDPRAIAGSYSVRQMARLAWAGLSDALRVALRLPRRYVGIIGKPGELAVMTSPDTLDATKALFNGDLPYENKVAARLVLELFFYRPILDARRLRIPLLVCVAERDQLIPGNVQRKAALMAPKGEATSYDAGHFDIYHGKWFERMVPDQIAFLRRAIG
jgi:dienelactone hydrolase